MKFIKSSGFRYLISGGINTLLTYGVYLLALFVVPYFVAYTISYISGIVISYLLNSIFVFKQALNWKSAFQYPLVYVVQYILGSILITFFVEIVGLDASIAALANVVVLLPITFVLTRFVLVKKKEKNLSSDSF